MIRCPHCKNTINAPPPPDPDEIIKAKRAVNCPYCGKIVMIEK